MRILLFSVGFHEWVIELANALVKFETVVLMIDHSNIRYKEHIKHLSKEVKLITFNLSRLRNPLSNLIQMRRITKAINIIQPDVIHIQSNGHLYFFSVFPFISKYPIVNTIHDAQKHMGDKRVKSIKLSPIFGKIFTTLYIAHCNYTKSQISSNYSTKPNNIHVVPLSNPYLSQQEPHHNQGKKKTILFIGRLWKYKGLETLLKAEPIISNEVDGVEIIIAGRGEPIESYYSFMSSPARFNIKNYRISYEEAIELFQSTSIVVLPYFEATQSGVIPMAYAFGKPVVATNVGGIPDQVVHGKTGYLVEPKDEEALAKAIVRILKDDSLREKMGTEAFQFTKNLCSHKNLASLSIKVYRQAILTKKG